MNRISSKLNLLDAFIVLGCTIFSAIITLFLTLHSALDNAQLSLRDEKSIFYRLYMKLLKFKRIRMMRD